MVAAAQAISVSHLRKTYREVVAVDDVSFDVEPGEIFGIIGPNGSGKTTTVECLQGIRRPDAGDVRVLDLDPRTQGEALRHRIGSQLQDSALPERLRVWEALDLFAAAAKHPRDWRELVREWGIEEQSGRAFAHLSGGQQQRLFVALALVNNPELVFLDEMTTGLDPAARRVAWALIAQVRERGATVVLVTHFMDEAERLCDRIAVFRAGRVVAVDTPAGLIARYGGGSVVRFTAPPGAELGGLDEAPGVRDVQRNGQRVEVRGEGPLLAQVAIALGAKGILPADLRVDLPALEDVYLRIMGEGGP